jgi:hypothetical protein
MRVIFIFVTVFISCGLSAQQIDKIIIEPEVLRIEKVLASDEMMGRRMGTHGIEKAAQFISEEYKKAGLNFLPGLKTYRQEFTAYSTRITSASGTIGNSPVDAKQLVAYGFDSVLRFEQNSGVQRLAIPADSNLRKTADAIISRNQPAIVFVDSAHRVDFHRIRRSQGDVFGKQVPILFVLTSREASTFNIEVKQKITEYKLFNVVGYLPGKSKPDEHVIFSAHYDHLGIGKPNAAGDSIYNGANDDAAGTTAVIMLAKYFAQQKSNERSLIFSAFTAEEAGGWGSKYFARQIDPAKVVAMMNIEMIGTESKWGTNSAYITGYDKSGLSKVLEKNLQGSKFKFYPDPYIAQDLFYRSDNASLAAVGVPAHTISTSKMDSEPYYHSQDDEIETLDLQNMTEIIKAIAISSKTLVSGEDTPSRVEK